MCERALNASNQQVSNFADNAGLCICVSWQYCDLWSGDNMFCYENAIIAMTIVIVMHAQPAGLEGTCIRNLVRTALIAALCPPHGLSYHFTYSLNMSNHDFLSGSFVVKSPVMSFCTTVK